VQVDPTKPILKPPGIKHWKLTYDILLSTSDFKFNLGRYIMAQNRWTLRFIDAETEREYFALQWGARRRLLRVAVPSAAAVAAGVYTRPHLSST